MDTKGFTLVELIVVIGIAAVLMAIGTLNFNKMMKTSAINSQVKMLYSELVGIRTQAMYQKMEHKMELATNKATTYYMDEDTNSWKIIEDKSLTYPVQWGGSSDVTFDIKGLANVSAITNKSICITEENDASYDSIVISSARIQMGKRIDPSGGCDSGNIKTQ